MSFKVRFKPPCGRLTIKSQLNAQQRDRHDRYEVLDDRRRIDDQVYFVEGRRYVRVHGEKREHRVEVAAR